MGKGLRLLTILFTVNLFMLTAMAEENKTASIEQVFIDMPDITAYGNGLSSENDEVQEAYLGGEKAQLSQKLKFSESGEGIYYYLLLDVSNSMPDAYFDQIKQAVLQFESVLGPNEHLVLYTFGETVNQIWDETHQKSESESALSKIKNLDNRTLLFEAISKAADDSRQAKDSTAKRKIIMVISDGEDFATGKTMSEEALQNLKEKGIPAYAFGIEATARENLNSFGEFSRRSGGELTIFNEKQASEALMSFRDGVMASDVLRFTASSNRVSNKMETFSLKKDNETLTKDVMVSKWIKDMEPPQLVRTEQVSDRQIELEFSEKVTGIELSSNYTIRKGEEDIAVSGVRIGTKDENGQIREYVVTLTVGQDLKPGDYEVFCSGIKDVSMEENDVSNSGAFTVEKQPVGKRILESIKDWYWIPVILIVAALIFLILFVYRKVKKASGIIYVDDKLVTIPKAEVHKHISIKEQEGKSFTFVVNVEGNHPETISLSLANSFIVGRSKICNLYFDDLRMSKQHFVMEWDGNNMYVTDLDTTNGTLVNGIRINSKRKLEQNDVISAGSTELIIRW